MERLDISHHHIIMIVLVLIVFVTGVAFGVKISAATQGSDGMEIIIFALNFLIMVSVFMVFTQVIHVRDAIAKSSSFQKTKRK